MSSTDTLIVEPGKWRQFFAAVIVNLMALNIGFSCGWPSPIIPQLISENTPVGSTPMTTDQISWLTSALSIGSFIILPFCSTIMEYFGRKKSAYFVALPACISWLLIIFATNFYHLLIARLCCGISMALHFVVMPIYVAEISGDSIRGQLGSFMSFSINIGITGSYVLGAVLSYKMFAITTLFVPIIFSGIFVFMPETPIYLVRKGRKEEAEKALMWLKEGDKVTVAYELERLQNAAEEYSKNDKSVGLKDLFRDRATIKGLIIALALTSGEEISGMPALTAYPATIFKMSDSSMDPNSAAIVLGAVQIAGAWLATLAMERAGRRSLVLGSCSAMALCLSIFATFILCKTLGYNVTSLAWIPVISLSSFALIYSIGIGTAAYVVASEIFRPDISSLGNSIAVTLFTLVDFSSYKFFMSAVDLIGLSGCFYCFALFCMCTFFIAYYLMPETKGKSIDAIIEELNGFSNNVNIDRYSVNSIEKDNSILA